MEYANNPRKPDAPFGQFSMLDMFTASVRTVHATRQRRQYNNPDTDQTPSIHRPRWKQVEMPAIPVLAGMEVSGVVFLPERVTRFSEALGRHLEGLTRTAVEAVGGRDFNLASPDQVREERTRASTAVVGGT